MKSLFTFLIPIMYAISESYLILSEHYLAGWILSTAIIGIASSYIHKEFKEIQRNNKKTEPTIISQSSKKIRLIYLAIFSLGNTIRTLYLLKNYYFAVSWLFAVFCIGIASWLFYGELIEEQNKR